MKAVILAGGMGTRISEETVYRPKPMIEIGGRPILWHVMKGYAAQGITDFVICLGYKGVMIREYFLNFYAYNSDVTVELASNQVIVHRTVSEPWRVTLVDTGDATMTGGRLLRIREHVRGETFLATYGDGVSDVDVRALVAHHRANGATATLTAVKPPGRFGAVELAGAMVERFREKPDGEGGWINGGFFVLEPAVFDAIDGDETQFEREPLERLAAQGRLSAYRHGGFWHPLDTVRDRTVLENYWSSGNPPWKTW
ncbi:MAG: glucose-1-phosphate cytidylyltransferase [Vulcanimicrobiaceae bacterium]|jgi:glucose-1-phosphate cytidylyltransferase